MTPRHHPGDDLLIGYAAGSQEEPVALIVATHLALCPRCRSEVERLEELGGVYFEQEGAEALSADSVERLLARLDEPAPEPTTASASRPANGDTMFPSPLRDYLGVGRDKLAWTTFRSLKKVELLEDAPGFRTRLMCIKSGTTMPMHSHEGSELTLILAGGYSDEQGHFLRGDLAEADASVDHRPVADPGEDCICLAVTDAPLRLTGPFARLLNPFLNI
jgi:putative transcriptional regulator